MISRLSGPGRSVMPNSNLKELKTESDVEQKLIYPFLVHESFLSIPSAWVRTKEYMEPTEIDKGAGKRVGYIPDYSIWLGGFPLLIVEAKSTEATIEKALREAQLYASRINNRYPPNLNPIAYVLACNGDQFALAASDSETEVLYARCLDVMPGSDVLAAFKATIGSSDLQRRSIELNAKFQSRRFHRTVALLTSPQINDQLGINPFAQELFPIITRYFGTEADEASDDIIDRGYVSSSERTEYGAVLETYLRDRARIASANLLQLIETSRSAATGLTGEIQRFRQNPHYFGRVQLIVGSVGAGKSLFIRRFYRRLLPAQIAEKTKWVFINFNVEFSPREDLRNVIANRFISSFSEINDLDLNDLELLEKLFRTEMTQFAKGPAKILLKSNQQQYDHQRYLRLKELEADKPGLVKAISRHYTGERGFGIVCVFDNVDKRSRDLQLEIFEAAQWLKDMTRALVIVNLRDTTFEAHRDEPPLDAFINAVNFYIRPPRFAEVIKKRLQIVLATMESEESIGTYQKYTLESGATIIYSSSRAGEFLMSIYISLFERRGSHIGAALEALVAKNVRRALGMFADIIASPHIPTSQITTAAIAGPGRIDEGRIIRALMRGRHRLFANRGPYVRNILAADLDHRRPSNFLYADILEFLIRSRKIKIDFSVEGYASAQTVVNRMGQLGYDEDDAFSSLARLVTWGLVEPESLLTEQIKLDDPVQVHAAGFIHSRYLLRQAEYVIGISPDLSFSSFELSETIAHAWSASGRDEPGFRVKQKILNRLADYFESELEIRCNRHAFYGDLGYGGRWVSQAIRALASEFGKSTRRGSAAHERKQS